MATANRVTLKQIARQLGVTATTVSRVLSGQARQYRISQKMETAVQRLAAEVGFTPNRMARGLRLNKTETIGVVIPDVSNPFFAGIVRQIALGARNCRYAIIVCDSQDSEDMEIESLDLLRGRGVEGIVLCPVGRDAQHLAKFETGDLPIVLADRYFPGVHLPYVASDNFGGAKEATTHLIQNGHRRIACLQGLPATSTNEDRLRGYREALTDHCLSIDNALVVGDSFCEQSGYIALKLLLNAASDFSAIFALSNLVALGAIRALAEEGLRIPDDISLVSFDDQPYSAYLAAPMTTVAQSSTEMGQIATKLLLDRIRSPERAVEGGILLPTKLVERASVRRIEEPGIERRQHHVCG